MSEGQILSQTIQLHYHRVVFFILFFAEIANRQDDEQRRLNIPRSWEEAKKWKGNEVMVLSF